MARGLTETLAETLSVFDGGNGAGEPLSTAEVAEVLETPESEAADRLDDLERQGILASKRLDGAARIWWPLRGVKLPAEVPSIEDDPGVEDASVIEDASGVDETGVLVLDADHEVIAANDRVLEYLGLDRDAVEGTDARELLQRRLRNVVADHETYAAALLDAYEEDRSASFEVRVLPVDDRRARWLEHRSRPVRSGPHEGKRIEVFEQLEDGFYALDEDLRFTDVDERTEQLLGTPAEELLGQPVREHFRWTGDSRIGDALHEAMETREQTSFEVYVESLSRRIEARVHPSEDGLSVYFRTVSEREGRERVLEERERILRDVYRIISDKELSFDGKVDTLLTIGRGVLDTDCAALSRVDGEDYVFEIVHDPEGETRQGDVVPLDQTNCERAIVTEETLVLEDVAEDAPELTERAGFTEQGINCYLGTPVEVDGEVDGTFCFYDRDRRDEPFTDWEVTLVDLMGNWVSFEKERRRRERELARQREQLAVLDHLNAVVRSVTDAVVEQSTRDEIEQVVCETIADADAYEFAWMAQVEPASGRVEPTAQVGAGNYLDEIEISSDPDDPTGRGPTGLAIHTGEMQVVRDVDEAEQYDPWRDAARRYGFRASAAIPITHEGTLYGVLNVYADREDAFADAERDVVGQLGEVVGHAIASVERKRALMGDEVVEIEFAIADVFADLDLPREPTGVATFDRVIPIGDGEYLVFGSATEDGLATLRDVTDARSYWESMTVFEERGGRSRFELRLSEPPVLSSVASQGGRIVQARIEAGDLHLTVQLPPSVDVRGVVEVIQESYPGTEMVTRQQVTRDASSRERLERALEAELTERQRSTLEAAYSAGFFEWPRDATGEEVADALGVSPPTFHQHVRAAERKLLESLFDETTD